MVWRATGATLEELERSGARSVEVEGRPVLLVRLAGAVHAVDGACPHSGGDLSEGTVEDGRVVCPLHGATFDLLSGSVLSEPFGGEPGSMGTPPLGRHAVRVVDGAIEVDLSEPVAPP